ncbi:ATP-binding cassette sub-family C member 4-like [Toxorhynchites rutilus septentrionalis]|uniref:ATP-binding cassette sub-family C member 4-like n=1 Tax=Toxorhynchites rutilus septentrionalis TaxID=329112 RepID=UPI00247A795A|nr:ATP-binding cassette sub-family C member 4-like [Toxorhynchites rutilus septentrionalis]
MEAPKIDLCRNPRQGANLLSVLSFWWTYDLFHKGSTKTLGLSDLYKPLEEDHADKLGDKLEKQWERQLKNYKKKSKGGPSLVKAIFRAFWQDWLLLSIITVFGEIILRIAQPFLLGRLLLYFRRQTDMTFDEALYFTFGMIATKAASVIVDNRYAIITALNGVRTRIAVCNIIYRKSLRLSRNALGDTSPGKVVNLMSNDVNRFDIVSYILSFMWSSPLVTIIVLVLLWYEVGWAGPIGLVVVFIVTPIQSFFGKLTSRYRLQTALKTDERIRLMDEIISGIQVIKMYAWEKPFAMLISLARKAELKIVLKSGLIRGMYMTFQLFTTRAALFATMITLILMEGELTAAKVFVVASYLNIVSHVMSGMFVRGVAEIAEALVAIRRLQNFLEYEEINDSKTQTNDPVEHNENRADIAIRLHSVTARWNPVTADGRDQEHRPPTLSNLSIEFRKGQLIGIVGAVGSGKSSILQAILRELPLESGHILNNEIMSYASQEPWLFAGSIRQNILFGSTMDRKRYKAVVRVCALETDLEQFAEGDETLIGERGVSLSGGQKARISLARAVYKESSVYLLDDPLSAVDAHVAKHLFDLCIGARGFLGRQRSTRILVTHQVHFLVQSDWIIVMDEGKIAAQGTPHDLHQHGIDFLELTEGENNGCNFSRQSSYSSVNSDCSEAELNCSHEQHTRQMEHAFEKSSEDTVDGSMFVHYAAAVENWAIIIGLVALFITTQLIVSFTDYWVSFWVSQEELRTFLSAQNSTDMSYHKPLGTDVCAYVQSAVVAGVFIIGLMRALGFYRTCARASQTIHDWSFRGFISATKHFFDTNPSGRILNRFSKDIGLMDEMLPKSIMDATQTVLTIIGAMLVILVVQPLFVIPMILLLGVLLYARKLYLKTSQNSRRLEAITHSPIFSHIATTLNGLPTIRSFSVQKLLITEFNQHQDVNTGAVFMFHSCRIAFGMMLDVIFFLFLSIVMFSFLLLETSALGDKVGLVVTQITSLGSLLQFGIRQSANMFNHLIAVERLLEYKNLPAEEQPPVDTALIQTKTWPSEGRIEFMKVNFRYFKDAPLVLRDLCLEVEPKQKVGIVGRTGAGKSSIVGALFRSAIVEGTITIDGVNTDEITMETLRSNISIIPQDPVLFSGTLRKNLDPFDKYQDSVLWNALELVELKDIANGPLGLQTYVAPGGSNFSVGQRQLVCLARAILRSNKILVLDEATANVDPETDRLIQQTIREHFADCTVLTIAHRLNTIIDYDRILVMSEGKAVEFGTPHELVQKPEGIFRDMLLATGQAESENLMNMAKK